MRTDEERMELIRKRTGEIKGKSAGKTAASGTWMYGGLSGNDYWSGACDA